LKGRRVSRLGNPIESSSFVQVDLRLEVEKSGEKVGKKWGKSGEKVGKKWGKSREKVGKK
jgi:hypothetical protein